MSESFEKVDKLVDDGFYQQAENILNNILKTDPSNADILRRLGVIQAKLGNYKKSELIFSSILELDPENCVALEGKGLALLRQVKHSEAKPIFEKIKRLYPDDIQNILNLALIDVRFENYDAAIMRYREALEIEPENEDVKIRLGLVLKMKNSS